MENLSQLEKESLKILKQLEHLCEAKELMMVEQISSEKIPGKSYLSIRYLDIDFSVLKKRMNIHAVESYLQKSGLPFYITSDFEFDDHMHLNTSPDPRAKYTEIGEVYGESIAEIKTKIKKLIRELNFKNTNDEITNKIIKLTFYVQKGILQVNEKSLDLGVGTIERTLVEILVQRENDVPWDIIMAEHDGIDYIMGDVSNEKVKESMKRCSDTKRRLNEKIKEETPLKIDLIKLKKNHYSLTKKVTKK